MHHRYLHIRWNVLPAFNKNLELFLYKVWKNYSDICIILCINLTIVSKKMSSFNLREYFSQKFKWENAWQWYLLKITFCFTSWSTSDNCGDNDFHRLGASGSGVVLNQNFDGVCDSVINLNSFCSEHLVHLWGIQKCGNILSK